MDIQLEIGPSQGGFLIVGRKLNRDLVLEVTVPTIEEAGRFARAFVDSQED